jgi:glycerol dehydrogenase-like iron-containing ADH family enzyme
MKYAHDFQTILGRNLVGELKNFVHRPFLLCTMEDMWPKFKEFFDGAECVPYFVHSVDEQVLLRDLAGLPHFEAVVGLGGGMAVDTAKFFVWKRRVPLFQIQTALSMNASWGHRAGIRVGGAVRYIGWAVPEAVYIDYDILRAAPRHLNWSGIGDILCNHTGVLDWRYATNKGFCESKWPYDGITAQSSLSKVEAVLENRQEIRELTDKGIDVLIDGLRHGTTYHGCGWNPRHIEGIDHFFFYSLEYLTGKKFLHGQPVCLGIYIGSLLHKSRSEEMLRCMADIGLDIRPESMGVTWDDVARALFTLKNYVKEKGLWYSIAHDTEITQRFVDEVRGNIESVYGSWN